MSTDAIFAIMFLITLGGLLYNIYSEKRVWEAESYAWHIKRLLREAYEDMARNNQGNTRLMQEIYRALCDGIIDEEDD